MTWFFWIMFSVFTTAAANIFQRVVMREKDNDPYGTNIIFLFATALMTGLFALSKGFILPPLGTYPWNFFASAFLWGAGSLLLFYAYQILGSSEIAIISSFGAVVTIIASILFLGETVTFQQIVGTILILSSIWIITKKKDMSFKGKGMLYALIVTILFGLAVTNDAFILKTYDAVSYTPVSLFFPALLLLLIKPLSIFSFRRLKNLKYSRNMFMLTFFYSVQAVAYYVALQISGNSSQIAPIYKSNIIVTVLLAVIFLKEKEHLTLKLISTLLVTIGVLLIK